MSNKKSPAPERYEWIGCGIKMENDYYKINDGIAKNINEQVNKFDFSDDSAELREALIKTEKHLDRLERDGKKSWVAAILNLIIVALTLIVALVALFVTLKCG